VAASPDQHTEIAKFKAIEGKTWNHPVLVGDVLLVRNGEEMVSFRRISDEVGTSPFGNPATLVTPIAPPNALTLFVTARHGPTRTNRDGRGDGRRAHR
jgi:hypothetical protein